MSADPLSLSAEVLAAARQGRGEDAFARLAALNPSTLAAALSTDAHRLAFWINVYNAGIQRELRQNPARYRQRTRFFARRGVTVADRHLPFNAIEHGLLRRSQFVYGLGYVTNPLPGAFERAFRLRRREPLIHFALNCGALSCPPIAAYDAATVHEQFEHAARAYLAAHTTYDPEANYLTLSRLLLWFRGDFGGPAGIRALLHRFDLLPPGARPRFRYASYDWTLALD